MNKLKNAQYIALVATALSVVGGMIALSSGSTIGMLLFNLGFITTFVSYIWGGFKTALKMAVKIAKWGWFIAPFPWGIPAFVMTFFFAIFVFVFIPIIPIRKAYKESLRA